MWTSMPTLHAPYAVLIAYAQTTVSVPEDSELPARLWPPPPHAAPSAGRPSPAPPARNLPPL